MNRAKGKVLLIDDDPGLLRLISIRLNTAGYDVIPMDSGERALAQFSIHRPQVVVTDLRMNGMDGMAVFEAVHQRYPMIPVIILTAHGTIPDAVNATKRGVFGFLTKPFESKTLLDQINKAIEISGNSQIADTETTGDTGWRREIITRNPVMEDVLHQARLVAESDISVFIHGESGTGKDLLARAIHKASPRHDQSFVAINCSAIPEPLLESELFGHSKGSFTGATRNHKGLFQAADKGSLFLDEIGDMPLAASEVVAGAARPRSAAGRRHRGGQGGCARDLRDSPQPRTSDARGPFPRRSVLPPQRGRLEIPALARRREDIPLLASHFLARLAAKNRREIEGFRRRPWS